MELSKYPRPQGDTGWGFHDSASTDARPADAAAYGRYLREELGMTWFKALVRGANKADLVEAFTRAGIECIVRLYAPRPHPWFVADANDVRAYVNAGAHYFEWGNEPNLLDEWDEGAWRQGAQPDRTAEQFLRNAEAIRAGGGIPLLPGLAPGGHYAHRPFLRTMLEWLQLHSHVADLEGAALAVHNRPFNRPLDHRDESGEHYLDYEWIDDLVLALVGERLPLLGTESGYEPGWRQDGAYPAVTLERHAIGNLEMLGGFRPPTVPPIGGMRWRDSLFCQCLWLVEPWGDPGRGFDSAHWHWNRVYGGDLPAVAALRAGWKLHPFARRFGWEQEGPPSRVTAEGVSYENWYGTPNHSDRAGHHVRYIVMHDTEGPRKAAFDWWRSANNPYESSAHDLVDGQGVVWRCVPYERAAHHAGGSRVSNLDSIGVELEYPAAPESPPWPEVQLEAAVRHVRALARAFDVPEANLVRHAEVDPKRRSDPRNLD
ncbi:MAG TPA: peptidoglycan recognition family protein [Anaerolineae bacterium]|nr:peptidoglycan recognition family protein [Anaerolineae bacterium]